MFNSKDFPPLPSQERRKTRAKSSPSPSQREAATPITTLNDLPDELLLQILDYLPALDLQNFQLASLISLSLTNQRLHFIVSERLYTSFNSFFCVPYTFLRTVVSNPKLAKKVKALTFCYGDGVHLQRKIYRPTIFDKKVIKDGLKKLYIPDWKAYATDCNNGNEQEILYATILMHTPNVTSLEIDDGPVEYKMPKWLDLVRWVVNGSGRFSRMHHFPHLRSIRIDINHLMLRHLVPLFKLQSLRELTLVGLKDLAQVEVEKAANLQRLVPQRSSLIEDLRLEHSFINAEVLSVLLNYVRALKHFEYHFSDSSFDGTDGEDYWSFRAEISELIDFPLLMLHYPTIATSLCNHGESLEILRLCNDTIEETIQRPSGVFGNLHGLRNLTHFEAPLSAFVNSEGNDYTQLVRSLPRSLKSLVITVGWEVEEPACMASLEHMAKHCREFLPYLDQVRIKTESYIPANLLDWKFIQEPLSQLGVDFVVQRGTSNYSSDGWDAMFVDSDTAESDEESLYSE